MTATPVDWTAGEPVLLVRRCDACGQRWYLPRDACPRCGGVAISAEPSAGRGVVVAATTVHRTTSSEPASGPIGIALVDLDEGVRVMGRCPPSTSIGRRVVVRFVARPAADAAPSIVPSFEVVGS
jgi:uncharacterized protein